MAASEVIVVDTQPFISHHQGTKRIESILEHWYKDLKANVVVSTDKEYFCIVPSVMIARSSRPVQMSSVYRRLEQQMSTPIWAVQIVF